MSTKSAETLPLPLDEAMSLHRLGRFAEAEALYREVLSLQPSHVDALHLLGALAIQTGRPALGVDLIRQSSDFETSAVACSNLAAGLCALGHFDEGLARADQAVALKSDHADAHSNRGAALKSLGRLTEALTSYERAIAFKPDFIAALNGHASLLLELKRPGEALAIYEKILALKPENIEAQFNRGVALHNLRRLEDALASCDKLITLTACGNAEMYFARGIVLNDLKRYDEAVVDLDKAIDLNGDYVEAFSRRALILKNLRRLDEALISCEKAISLAPTQALPHSHLGVVLHEMKRYDESLASYARAIALKPEHVDSHANQGVVLLELGRLNDALASYDTAVALDADHAEAQGGRAIVLHQLRRMDEALAHHDRAIMLRPDWADGHHNRSLCLLLMGQYEQAWPDYEWRHKLKTQAIERSYPYPLWLGEQSIKGKTLFIHSEQGLGDTIQFCRYLPILEARGARVRCAPQKVLRPLLRSLSPTIEFVDFDDPMQPFDYHCYLASLPAAFNTGVDTIPAQVPYLAAEPERVERWRRQLGSEGFKIGINWQGSTRKIDMGRSFPLALFEAIAAVPGVRLISLQKNEGTEQLEHLPKGMRVETLGDDYDAGAGAFVDAAAVMQNLDLIITSDTAIAHLAGALGRPTWVALKHIPDWRWLLDRNDCPWYPSMRLFRQSVAGDWLGVFHTMATELQRLVLPAKLATPMVPTSWGELIDKITILRLKSERISDEAKLANVREELTILQSMVDGTLPSSEALSALWETLYQINADLWVIEDDIRLCDANNDFGPTFIALARAVYHTNDRRAAVKKQINLHLGSALVEEKSYQDHSGSAP